MLRVHTLPGSLRRVLEAFRPCFTAPTFTTFVTLLAGLIARPANRTVCGMLAGVGLAGVWHHSRAHRFFATARWHPDTVGLAVLRLILGHLVPIGAPLVIAVDDTLFRAPSRRNDDPMPTRPRLTAEDLQQLLLEVVDDLADRAADFWRPTFDPT